MSSEKRVQKKTYVLLAATILFNSIGNVLLSNGMKQVGEISEFSLRVLISSFLKVFTNGSIWLGVLSLLLFFVSYLLLLSWADLSYVLPVSAIGYALVALLGYLLLDEVVTPARWIGVLFICGGVALVSGTAPSTTDKHQCEQSSLSR
jgi:drug/metabolite transporter (DMT)-like permease